MSARFLPRSVLTLDDARSRLAGWHFGQESLTRGEREILYVAEALLRALDELTDDFEQGGTGAILDGSVAGAAEEDDNR